MLEEIPFWNHLSKWGNSIALIDGLSGEVINYRTLDATVSLVAETFAPRQGGVLLLSFSRTIPAIVCYLACLRAGCVVLPVSETASPSEVRLTCENFQPEYLALCSSQEVGLDVRYSLIRDLGGLRIFESHNTNLKAHAAVRAVMPTSGSMSKQKYVRLSERNLAVSAAQVSAAMALSPQERAITVLPLNHVFGLSVLHGQIAVGGSLLVSPLSVLDHRFWDSVRNWNVTALSGVPWTFEIMQKLGISTEYAPTLNKFSLSGGRTSVELRDWLVKNYVRRDAAVLFMYGQTEAAGRITVLKPELAGSDKFSVGTVVPGGSLKFAEDGEILYSGANVMMGYARQRDELAQSDLMRGELPTGDLGKLSEDGRLYLYGRKDREVKIYGVRINLDELEAFYRNVGAVAVMADHHVISVYGEMLKLSHLKGRTTELADHLRLPISSIRVYSVRTIPRTDAGKILYPLLGQCELWDQ
jgi:acyl-CoA synthetase (AMP-forming)/AMP-acid ligase II